MSEPQVKLQGVYKHYPGGANVYDDLNLTIMPGEFVSVFGAIGCGKTTLLKLIGGLEQPTGDEGIVEVARVHPRHAKIGFVFQAAGESLFPWTSAIGNVAFSLQVGPNVGSWSQIQPGLRSSFRTLLPKSVNKWLSDRGLLLEDETVRQARRTLEHVGLSSESAEKYPYALSGGQLQLVALARAIAPDPVLLLLDEPFNNLDYDARLRLQMVLWDWWKGRNRTVVFVSHDPETAVALGTRLLVLSHEHPTKVIDDIESDLPIEREFRRILTSKELIKMRDRLLKYPMHSRSPGPRPTGDAGA